MPESLINNFGKEIFNTTWDFLTPDLSSTELTEVFQSKVAPMIDHHLPLQCFTVTDSDQPWVTKKLKTLKHVRKREYCHHGKSTKSGS